METGKTLQGGINLTFDAVVGITRMVEHMHRNIAATPWPLDEVPQGPAQGITGSVYKSFRAVTQIARRVSDRALAGLSPLLDGTLQPGPHREAVVSALNGLCGDHLARSDNNLAIPMRLRVLVPPAPEQTGGGTFTEQSREKPVLFADLFEVERSSVEIYPRGDAFTEEGFKPTGRILLLAHGLCMNDRAWTSRQHNHAQALAEDNDYTPVYALYNSGLNISTNGREFCKQITGLLDAWPVPVESVTFVGFSMGGLVARSAMAEAGVDGHAWLDKVDKAVYVGTPHHGAAMERGGFWLQKSLNYSPYTAPLSALGRSRSAGITDLRHGNLCDDDWQHHDRHEDNADYRRPLPLADGIQHYAIAATRSSGTAEDVEALASDGLVHPASATGRHADPDFDLAFPAGHTKIIDDLGHLAMLHDSRVLDQLKGWLGISGECG